jgi:cyclopropane fatty-acyl-phospholipid synthase-like methyltransferase
MLRKLWFNIAYLSKPIWDTGISPPELIDFIDHHDPAKALDFGCGTGTNAITLAKNGWQVTGVDFSKRAIHIAQKKAQQAGLQIDFYIEDVTQLKSITGKFDLILDIGCFHGLPANRRPEYLQKIDQLLADSGTFLLYLFIKANPDANGPGVSDRDIQTLAERFYVAERKDSTERGIRPSAWFTLRKQA